MNLIRSMAYVAAGGVALIASACSGSGSSSGNGSVEVRVTDAPPAGVTKALVTTKGIEVHKAGAADDAGWVTVISGDTTFDLVAVSGVEKVLGTGTVAAGKYTQVRMLVSSVTVTSGGKDIQATVPSDKLKIVGNFTVEAGKTLALTLDFDGSKSLVLAGDNAAFKPVIQLSAKPK